MCWCCDPLLCGLLWWQSCTKCSSAIFVIRSSTCSQSAKNLEDVRLQVLEERQAFKCYFSTEGRTGVGRPGEGLSESPRFSDGSWTHHRTSYDAPIQRLSSFSFLALLTLAKPVNVMRFFYERMFRSREFEGATCLCTATLSERAVFRVAACCM